MSEKPLSRLTGNVVISLEEYSRLQGIEAALKRVKKHLGQEPASKPDYYDGDNCGDYFSNGVDMACWGAWQAINDTEGGAE